LAASFSVFEVFSTLLNLKKRKRKRKVSMLPFPALHPPGVRKKSRGQKMREQLNISRLFMAVFVI
jgi:hypothetical protein